MIEARSLKQAPRMGAKRKAQAVLDAGGYKTRDGLLVGNQHGSAYARLKTEMDEMKSRLTAVERDNKELKAGIRELKQDNRELNDNNNTEIDARISALEEGFYTPRNRFLSTFKRDILKTATPAEVMIKEEKACANRGNALWDAELYEKPIGRTDFGTYKALYGLHPAVVRTICKLSRMQVKWYKLIYTVYPPTIRALNRHATIAVSRGSLSTEASRLFTKFIGVLETAEFPKDYLESNTPLSSAYWSFWRASTS